MHRVDVGWQVPLGSPSLSSLSLSLFLTSLSIFIAHTMTDDVGFLRSTLGRLARQQPVRFPNDFSTPPADRKRKPTTVDVRFAAVLRSALAR